MVPASGLIRGARDNGQPHHYGANRGCSFPGEMVRRKRLLLAAPPRSGAVPGPAPLRVLRKTDDFCSRIVGVTWAGSPKLAQSRNDARVTQPLASVAST